MTSSLVRQLSMHLLSTWYTLKSGMSIYQEVLGNHWERRVYIATDDPSVVKEAINK